MKNVNINCYNKISTHDCVIDSIKRSADDVVFAFDGGVRIDTESFSQPNACICVKNGWQNTIIKVTKRIFKSRKGLLSKLYIIDYMSLEKFANKMLKDRGIELFEEYYLSNGMLWQGTIVNKSPKRKNKYYTSYDVDIECNVVCDSIQIEYHYSNPNE